METDINDIVTKEDLWYIDNYIVLRDYYDRTVSRIAARCVRMGNIALEEYPQYGYILDVLEEICETGTLILSQPKLHPFIEKKIAGGVAALEKNLAVYQEELRQNSSPEMIKQDPTELSKMKDTLGMIDKTVDKSVDPTVGAGMSMDDLVEKLLKEKETKESQNGEESK